MRPKRLRLKQIWGYPAGRQATPCRGFLDEALGDRRRDPFVEALVDAFDRLVCNASPDRAVDARAGSWHSRAEVQRLAGLYCRRYFRRSQKSAGVIRTAGPWSHARISLWHHSGKRCQTVNAPSLKVQGSKGCSRTGKGVGGDCQPDPLMGWSEGWGSVPGWALSARLSSWNDNNNYYYNSSITISNNSGSSNSKTTTTLLQRLP